MELKDAEVPDAYTTLETVVKVDRERIRKELEEGKQLAFAKLGERGESLRIK
jgi:precorrin-2 methylase